MKKRSATEMVIDDMVTATCGGRASAREMHIFREALRGLVRLARAEQMAEIRTNADRLTGAVAARSARRRARAILQAQRLKAGPAQTQLEFSSD